MILTSTIIGLSSQMQLNFYEIVIITNYKYDIVVLVICKRDKYL